MYEAQVLNPDTQLNIALSGRNIVTELCSDGSLDMSNFVNTLMVNVSVLCISDNTTNTINDCRILRAESGKSNLWFLVINQLSETFLYGKRYAAKVVDARIPGSTNTETTYTPGKKMCDFFLDEFVVDTIKTENILARYAYQIQPNDGSTPLTMAWYADESDFINNDFKYSAPLYKNNTGEVLAISLDDVTHRGAIIKKQ